MLWSFHKALYDLTRYLLALTRTIPLSHRYYRIACLQKHFSSLCICRFCRIMHSCDLPQMCNHIDDVNSQMCNHILSHLWPVTDMHNSTKSADTGSQLMLTFTYYTVAAKHNLCSSFDSVCDSKCFHSEKVGQSFYFVTTRPLNSCFL